MTNEQAVKIGKRYGLEAEVVCCIYNMHMDPWDALREWDIIPTEEELHNI